VQEERWRLTRLPGGDNANLEYFVFARIVGERRNFAKRISGIRAASTTFGRMKRLAKVAKFL
jgi:hypothetical protein